MSVVSTVVVPGTAIRSQINSTDRPIHSRLHDSRESIRPGDISPRTPDERTLEVRRSDSRGRVSTSDRSTNGRNAGMCEMYIRFVDRHQCRCGYRRSPEEHALRPSFDTRTQPVASTSCSIGRTCPTDPTTVDEESTIYRFSGSRMVLPTRIRWVRSSSGWARFEPPVSYDFHRRTTPL